MFLFVFLLPLWISKFILNFHLSYQYYHIGINHPMNWIISPFTLALSDFEEAINVLVILIGSQKH